MNIQAMIKNDSDVISEKMEKIRFENKPDIGIDLESYEKGTVLLEDFFAEHRNDLPFLQSLIRSMIERRKTIQYEIAKMKQRQPKPSL